MLLVTFNLKDTVQFYLKKVTVSCKILLPNTTIILTACIANGTIYGPGSAMDSSTQCEYCYCLGGRQECVKPKCLLPLEGCTPVYETHSCCPVRYNCTRPALPSSTSTTTIAPQQLNVRGKQELL